MTADEPTPFWNMNIPTKLHTKECPEYLKYAFEHHREREMLGRLDADYHRQTWQEVQQLISKNRLDLFERVPSDLRRYREYCGKLNTEYGSVMDFVMKERLRWENLKPKGEPFADPGKAEPQTVMNGSGDRLTFTQTTTRFSTTTGRTASTAESSTW